MFSNLTDLSSSRSPSARRDRPLTAFSMLKSPPPNTIKRRSLQPRTRTLQCIRSEPTADESQNHQLFLHMFNAKCRDSKITYSSKKALTFLSKFSKSDTSRRLRLDSMDLGFNSMLCLCEILESQNYFHVDLERNRIGDGGAMEMAKTLQKDTAIVYLNLGSNGIKEVGAEYLFEALRRNSTLTHFELGSKNGLNKNSIKAGTKSLCEALKVNDTLYYLGLSHTHLNLVSLTLLYEGLKINKSLVDLNLSSNQLGPDSMDMLIKILRNHELVSLNLSHNQLGNGCTLELFQFFNAYNRNLKLKTLIYDGNGINHKVGNFVFESLRFNVSIKKLSLGQNSFPRDIPALSSCLSDNYSLEELHLDDSQCTPYFARSLSAGLAKAKQLKVLTLNNNKLGNDGAALVFASLSTNRSLHRLEMKKCDIGDQAVVTLAESLRHNRTLQSLILTDNYINDEGGKEIRNRLGDNQVLKEVGLSSNLMGFRILNSVSQKMTLNKSKQLEDKIPMRRESLKIMDSRVRREELQVFWNTQKQCSKILSLQEEIQILEKNLVQKANLMSQYQQQKGLQLEGMEIEIKDLQKWSISNNGIAEVKREISVVEFELMKQNEAVGRLTRELQQLEPEKRVQSSSKLLKKKSRKKIRVTPVGLSVAQFR